MVHVEYSIYMYLGTIKYMHMYIPAYVLQPDYGGTCETSYSLICSTAYFILTWLLIYMLQQLGYLLQQSPPGSAPVSSVPASCLCHCLPFDLYSTRTLSELVLVQYIPKSRLSKSVVIQPCCLSSVFATGAHHYLHTLQTTGGDPKQSEYLVFVGRKGELPDAQSLPPHLWPCRLRWKIWAYRVLHLLQKNTK